VQQCVNLADCFEPPFAHSRELDVDIAQALREVCPSLEVVEPPHDLADTLEGARQTLRALFRDTRLVAGELVHDDSRYDE